MLFWSLIFFVVAIVAAIFGFSGIATGAVWIGKLLFVVFLVLALATWIISMIRQRPSKML